MGQSFLASPLIKIIKWQIGEASTSSAHGGLGSVRRTGRGRHARGPAEA